MKGASASRYRHTDRAGEGSDRLGQCEHTLSVACHDQGSGVGQRQVVSCIRAWYLGLMMLLVKTA